MLLDAGVPWEIVTTFSKAKMLGWCVAAGELKGRKWSWSAMEWERPPKP